MTRHASTHICGPAVYRYEGVLFEIHDYCGPWPLTQSGAPRAHAPRAFWELWQRFKALPPTEQQKYRITERVEAPCAAQ